MYARHPESFWNQQAGEYLAFEKIRSDQSFNWSAFSIPIWVRFNDRKVYQENYIVVGYYVNTIRNTHKLKPELPPNSYGLKHDPIENNYSHCELYPDKIEKKWKRAYRITLKHKFKIIINSHSNRSTLRMGLDYSTMYFHRFFVLIRNLLEKK